MLTHTHTRKKSISLHTYQICIHISLPKTGFCARFGIGPMIWWRDYQHSALALRCMEGKRVQQIGTPAPFMPFSFLPSFSVGATGRHKHTHTHTCANPVYTTYLNTTLFLCHVDFLLCLTLKVGHHLYSTACMAASMTKPSHSQQRCASVEGGQ